ncbi:hypothetical protein JI666_03455 [Bacillus sp. NTK071]|uniref:hypothetical protein n=1 Tax=Bacillus sp. NTK071 TaxID=2802175 RepID=UPI001A8D02C0|nr:hypothetical protein [Bacillus sp. NTK071]MBN8207800.1 hypothetical protein [Bacillus sp. NTK071]
MANCSTNAFCCPVPCSTPDFFGGANTTLIGIKRCLPVRTVCQVADPQADPPVVPVPETLYIAPEDTPPDSLASGMVSIINTSSTTNNCIMTVTITDGTNANPQTYTIDAQSSLMVQVTDLNLITVFCASDPPQADPLVYCTATVELDLQYKAGL